MLIEANELPLSQTANHYRIIYCNFVVLY